MDNVKIDTNNYKHIHFIGIGGISMSGLAEIMLNKGFKVSGSDAKESHITKNLEKKGIKIFYSHSPSNLEDSDLVVYTDAVSLDNLELKSAIDSKIDIIDRANFLGQLMKEYKKSIAISGTHGKTTTTSMAATILLNSNFNPTILLGGELDLINGNTKIGNNEIILTEACEYKANILKYFPTTIVVLNIDEDHLDYFDNMEHILNTFKTYANNLKEDDFLILNIDDEYTRHLINSKCKIITISKENQANFQAKNISYLNDFPSYDLYYNNEFKGRVNLKVNGGHNITNSLGAIASCVINGISFDDAINSISNYTGVHRRLEYKGNYNGTIIEDDYAHHPTEIKASLSALKEICKGELYCVFQPHTFTRTKYLLDSFSKSFNDADYVIITDIYAAREKDYGDIHSKTLCDAISSQGKKACYIDSFEKVVNYLKNSIKENDILVTMGAGDVYKIGEMILK